jgi:transposase InsO family protein
MMGQRFSDLRLCGFRREAEQPMIAKQQYHRLMKEYHSTGNVTMSAMKADVSRPTARKYLAAQEPPDRGQVKHHWRTRLDPLAAVWVRAEAMLKQAPELEAKTLWEYFQGQEPWNIAVEHLRTFQRRVAQWRLHHGPDKEVFFAQDRVAGKALQLDWTHAEELGVTIGGQVYDHLLCHVVLPYSNWEWATRCRSESLLSLRHGLQESLQRLGKAPAELQIDNSSAATHRIGSGQERVFNQEFVSICAHYGLAPRTIGIGCPNENGDVESSNGHLKRRLKQHLLLRGSSDFGTEADYDRFREGVLERANGRRGELVARELAVMKALPPTRLSEYEEVYCPVSKYSTIRVKKVGYSVPARWIGHEVKVEVHESELRIYAGRELLLTLSRHGGDRGVVLDYRHVIDHLLRKPGAFEEYRYREELFLSPTYRQAYDRLIAEQGSRRGTLEYLRLLKLTSETGPGEVELMLVEYTCPPYPAWSVAEIRKTLLPALTSPIHLVELQPECQSYDGLLTDQTEVSHVG